MTTRSLVCFHAFCNDGFTAAWVAHLHFGDGADYLPVQYGQAPPDVDGREVYILDFSYKRQVTIDLSQKAKRLVVLDHHKTAAAELLNLSAGSDDGLIRFDMNKSGARLAWEYFFPSETPSWLVDYTEDRDLWRWALPRSKEVNAALASLPHDFKVWDDLHARFNPAEPGRELETQGAAILRYQAQQVDAICSQAREVELAGHKILAVNTSVLFSEVAGKLADGRPFGAAWFQRGDGKKQWSLRSRDGGVDVSEIAKARGGGGHRNAAGFEETMS